MNNPRPASRPHHLILAALLLAALFALALGSSMRESPTFDEGFYIARGWAFLKTGHLMPLGHPPLTNLLSGLGVLLEPGLPHPTSLQGWAVNDAEQVSEDLLWNRGINTTRVVLLARLPILWLGLLLGALVYRWGREEYGPASAILALTLYAFCPNVLAHAGLATTDLGVAAFFVAALYAWTRFLHRRTAGWLAISGLAFGLAQAAKYSALALIPLLGVMTIWFGLRRGPLTWQQGVGVVGSTFLGAAFDRLARWPLGWLWTALLALLLMAGIGLVVLWAVYLFSLQPDVAGARYPLSAYVSEFQHFLGLAAEGHRAYLLGRFSDTGWWYYHPFALAVKTTLPTLILLALATLLAVGREMRASEWEIAFPALIYLGLTMLGSLNVGIRYLLPMIPLMFLFAARTAYGPLRTGWLRPSVLATLATAHIAVALWNYPAYLAFFNLAAGGPDNGYRLLADSNLDWGQDLPGLADYLERHGIGGPIYLSYFGQADPAYYGIDYVALPGWPPPPPDPNRPPFYPLNPAPGLYAISASNLVGAQLYDPDDFGYFRARRPVATIGHSIFLYEVTADVLPETGQAGPWFAQCAAPEPSETEARLARLTGVDSLRHLYFDCRQALPFLGGPGWVLIPEGLEPVVDLGEPDFLARTADGSPRYRVWVADAAPPAPQSSIEFPPVPLPVSIAAHVELLGYHLSTGAIQAGDSLVLTAWWRVREPPPPPVSIFAHLLAPDGSLLLAGDALGVRAEDWRPGTVIVQQHTFPIPPDTPAGSYTLAMGLYSLSTGERFLIAQSGERVIDRIVLRTVQISDSSS